MFPIKPPTTERFELSAEFIDYLDRVIKSKEMPTSLKAIFTISNFKSADEFLYDLKKSGFKLISDYGCVFYLTKKSEYGDVRYLALFTENHNPIFFTLATKTKEIPPTLLEYLNKSPYISNLWISLTKMDELVESLKKEYSDQIMGTYFTGTYSPFFKRKALIRPNIERFVEYRGDDAIQIYEEYKKYYGILPRVFEFNLIGYGTYRLDYRGILVIKARSSFNFIYQLMDSIVSEVEKSKQKITRARVLDKFMKTKRKEFKINIKIPWSIKLTEQLECVKFDDFVKVLEPEWQFLPLDIDISENAENSEFLDFSYFRVIDLIKPSEFSVVYNNKNLKIYPSDKLDLGSSLRFFQSVRSSLDPSAYLT
ncbi:hypothetical protein [Archaeoglobus fulgidus]|nr:hypothetical protein [Archaeoglobus fulgidus]